MGKALYRKYRSKKLSEIIGQPHITETLARAIKSGQISHAYLFTGPRGVGKTSVARILAHEINGLPYQEDETNHLDIIEIDAASNRRIDEIRELKERVHIAPTTAKYKVYIIDEVHMLTKEAFNALLKTLEEPPAHVVFILATTESHKLPDTIISRTQRFGFRPIDHNSAIAQLKAISKQENITINDEALQLIADHGDGSFRDSLSLLDQVRHIDGSIEASHVYQALGMASNETITKLIQALSSGQLAEVSEQLQQVQAQGTQPANIAKQLSKRLKEELLNQPMPMTRTLKLLKDLSEISAQSNPSLALELALYEQVLETNPMPVQASAPVQIPSTTSRVAKDVEKPASTQVIEESKPAPIPVAEGELDWEQVLNVLKKRHNTLYGVVRMATPEFSDQQVVLHFSFPFHQKRLSESKNQEIVATMIHELCGKHMSVKAVVSKEQVASLANSETPVISNDNIDLTNVSNIFGGAEIVES